MKGSNMYIRPLGLAEGVGCYAGSTSALESNDARYKESKIHAQTRPRINT
jgi:hypothetical protein